MSYVFAGTPIETKPADPRKDVVPGSNNTPNFQYSMHTSIDGVSENSIALIVGDSIDRAKEQSIHSAFKRMLNTFQLEINGGNVPPATPYTGYHYTIGISDTGSQVVREGTTTGALFTEAAMVQDKLNLVVYLSNYTESNYVPAEAFMKPTVRLLELAREKRYMCTPELIRDAAPVADAPTPVEGTTVTISAPTWTGAHAGRAYWMKDGVTIQPHQVGTSPLTILNAIVFDSGFYQVKAGQPHVGNKAPDQFRTSVGAQLDVTPTDIVVNVGLGGTSKVALYGADTKGSNPYGSIVPTDVAGGGDALGYTINSLVASPSVGITRLSISGARLSDGSLTLDKRLRIRLGTYTAALSRNPSIRTEWNSDNERLLELIKANFNENLTLQILGFTD